MKYISDYIQDAQTQAFKDAGAFFAFSNKQLDEQKEPGITYTAMFAGLVCPVDNAKELVTALGDIHDAGIAQDIEENGIKGIIHRELANHEAQITNDIEDTFDALEQYGITREAIDAEYGAFFQHCVDNDYF